MDRNPQQDATLRPVPAAVLAPPGVVVKTPEELAAEGAQLPYAKADRTPEGGLKELHAFAAEYFSINPDRLISLAGQVTEHGSVVLFARNALESAEVDPVGYAIASYDSRYEGFKMQLRGTEPMAREAFVRRVEVLS